MFLVNSAGFPSSLYSTLLKLGLTTNLQLCLDAGDAESYTGSGQVWKDRSGGGYDFNLGATSSSEGADPTFNGTAGNVSASEYFSFDGGDYCTLGQSNPTWAASLSKDNAIYALAAWGWWGGTGSSLYLFNTSPLASSPGAFIRVSAASQQMGVTVYNSGGIALNVSAGATISTGGWHFLGIVVDEGAATGSVVVDGVVTALSSTAYSTPSASNPTQAAQIGGIGTSAFSPAGSRVASVAMWTGTNPTTTQLASIFTATRGKFGV
jgi:hypothetical protein